MAKTYIIKTKADITQSMIDLCLETSIDTLRVSTDGLQSVLKWSSADPPMFSADTKYTHAEILAEMGKPLWSGDPRERSVKLI